MELGTGSGEQFFLLCILLSLQVMQKYFKIKNECPDYTLPRILGLTATVISGNANGKLFFKFIIL